MMKIIMYVCNTNHRIQNKIVTCLLIRPMMIQSMKMTMVTVVKAMKAVTMAQLADSLVISVKLIVLKRKQVIDMISSMVFEPRF